MRQREAPAVARWIVAGLIIGLGVFVIARSAAAAESVELEAKLPTYHRVYCNPAPALNSYTSADDPQAPIFLAFWVCDLLLHGKPGDTLEQPQVSWSTAVHTLLHEWWHTAFREHDEKLTDCGAWAIFPYALVTYWGFTPARADREYRAGGYGSFYAPLPCTFTRP